MAAEEEVEDLFDESKYSEWETVFEREDATIKRRYEETENVYRFYTRGVWKSIPAAQLYELNLDLKYRKSWDANCHKIELVESKEIPTGLEQMVYWSVSYPWPMSKRDYVYRRLCKNINDGELYTIDGQASEHEQFPESKSSGVRVSTFQSQLHIRPLPGDPGSCEYVNMYMENPGGSIPSWLINWALKTGVPKGLDDIRKAVEGYEKYKKKQEKKK